MNLSKDRNYLVCQDTDSELEKASLLPVTRVDRSKINPGTLLGFQFFVLILTQSSIKNIPRLHSPLGRHSPPGT